MMHASSHSSNLREDPRDPFHTETEIAPSNRSFGLVFALVFALVAVLPWWRGGPVRLWALVVAGLFGLDVVAAPGAYA
jgi:hypothetical protein